MIPIDVTLAFIDGLGGMEMLLIFGIVLLLFGGDKLPEFARGLGKTMREFKKAAAGVEEEFKRAMEEDERKRAAAATPVTPASPTEAPPAEQPAYTYPDDGTTDYSSQAGPDAPATPATPAAGDPAAAATSPSSAPAEAPAAAPAEAPPPAAKKPPVVSEDYP